MAEPKNNTVLIVDDEESNIFALTHILSPLYTILVVKDGQDAIEVSQEQQPEVILLDIVMPEMDGYSVLAALKASDITKNIPVIFITGLSAPDDEEKGLALGAADYIIKPFSPAVVKLRVQNQMQLIDQTRQIIAKETAEKISHARSEFLSRMSHEMRTPMNAIMGMTSIMQSGATDSKQSEMLEKIAVASEQLLKIIDNVLDLYDIEDNKLRLTDAPFDFGDMIDRALAKAGKSAEAKGQMLTNNIDPSIPDAIIGDESRLEQVIDSLLSNAVKFSPERCAVGLNAYARGVEGDALTIQIEVADNGIGMSAQEQKALFIPFEQAYGGVDRKYGGAGMSLAISQYIVGLMGGEIEVDSQQGKGSVFSFTAKFRLQELETSEQERAAISGKLALLVDDVEINREIVMAMLEDAGLEFECAENGREALEMFEAAPGKYDVILMDINMPEMDGVEATRRIRASDAAEGIGVPIIAMTANVLMSEVESYIEAGMNAHIGKPVDYNKLMAAIAGSLP